VVVGSLIISHLSYHMTLSIWLNLFDHSVELGSSDISGPTLSSRYESSRYEKWSWWSEPYLAGTVLWSGELVVVVRSWSVGVILLSERCIRIGQSAHMAFRFNNRWTHEVYIQIHILFQFPLIL
jgi:hypothetical protein